MKAGNDGKCEFCPLAKDLEERINAYVAAKTPRRALPSEVADVVYGDDDADHCLFATIMMDRLEAAGMKIVKEA